MRRWLRRVLYGLLILIVIALLTVQVVMWTDWPRRLVLKLVQQNLGLRVEAQSLSTGWLGNTTLSNVKLSLPLASESFLDMPTMKVQHTALLPLLITRDFDLQGIELNKPNLVVRRDQAGRWNVQDVAELIAKATAGTPEPGTKKKPPKLPRLRLNDGTVAIIDDRNNGKALITPVTASGDPEGPLVYRYHLNIPEKLVLNGSVAPGEDFKHSAEFHVDRVPDDWLKVWMDKPPQPLRLDGKWNGVVVNKKAVAGRLELRESQIGIAGVRGTITAQTSGDESILTPRDLTITTTMNKLPTVQLASGTVLVRGDVLTLQQVRLGAVGGLAQIDGSADLNAKTAEINGIWQDIVAPANIAQSGTIQLSVKNLFPSSPSVTGAVATRGRLAQGAWDGLINIQGSGKTWTEMDWTLRAPRLSWKAKRPIEVQNVTAQAMHRGGVITLTKLEWPNVDNLVSSGEYKTAEKTWFLRVRGGSIVRKSPKAPANVAETAPLNFNLDVYGNPERVHLNELFMHARGIEARAMGDWVFNLPKPIEGSIFITHFPSDLIPEEELPIRGKLLTEAHVSGTLAELELDVVGVVRSQDLVIWNRPYGDIRGNIVAKVTKPNTVHFDVKDMQLFGGGWTVSGVWPHVEKGASADSEVFRVNVAAKDVSLREIGEAGGTKDVDGKASGSWTIDVTEPKRNLISARGSFNASDVVAGQFKSEKVTGQMELRNGALRIDPIELHRGNGITVATIDTQLADIQKPTVIVNTTAWPVPIGTGSAEISGEANLVLDTRAKKATGPVKARATFASTQRSIGEASFDGRFDGRIAVIDAIKLTGLSGTGEGRATINLDKPNESSAVLGWNGVDGKGLIDFFPNLAGLAGNFSGALTLDPTSTADRAVEPLRLRFQLNSDGGRFRTIDIGPVKLSAFLRFDDRFDPTRLILDKLPSEGAMELQRESELDGQNVPITERPLGWNDIRIADGRVRLWARRGRHSEGEVQTHIILDFSRLNLNQIVHAIKPDADHMPGRLAGQLISHGNAKNPDGIIGDGRIRITESDLGEVDVLKVLYDAMSLGSQPKTPIGEGSLDLSLQRSTLTLNRVHYFNRGAEAWSNDLTISDVWKLPNSPISGYVVGSARPLSAMKLPLLADVDQILSVLQSNLTTVHMRGTVANYEAKQGSFEDVTGGLKRFLTGQVNEAKK